MKRKIFKSQVIFLLIMTALGIFNSISPQIIFAQEKSQIFSPRVLFIAFNPVEGNKNMAKEFYGWYYSGENENVEEWENRQVQKNIDSFKRLSNNTINYQLVKKINISQFPKYTNGFQYSFAKFREWGCASGDPQGNCERQKLYFDYISWIKDNHICEIAQENDVDEIWIMSIPFIMTWESFMIGPSDSFGINGPGFNIPECLKHYAVMNMVYSREDTILHIFGHRIEDQMRYLTQNWKEEDYQLHWKNFSAIDRYSEPYDNIPRTYPRVYCGNTHFPSNALTHYDYYNHETKTSSCPDWKNFPNYKGEVQNINCEFWGCNDSGWQELWFSSLPRGSGYAIMTDKMEKKFISKKTGGITFFIQIIQSNFSKTPQLFPRT